jgi:hypothetical protein
MTSVADIEPSGPRAETEAKIYGRLRRSKWFVRTAAAVALTGSVFAGLAHKDAANEAVTPVGAAVAGASVAAAGVERMLARRRCAAHFQAYKEAVDSNTSGHTILSLIVSDGEIVGGEIPDTRTINSRAPGRLGTLVAMTAPLSNAVGGSLAGYGEHGGLTNGIAAGAIGGIFLYLDTSSLQAEMATYVTRLDNVDHLT